MSGMLTKKTGNQSLMARVRTRFGKETSRMRRAMEKATLAALPARYTVHRCTTNGRMYLREWRRETVGGLFTSQRIIWDEKKVEAAALNTVIDREGFDPHEFDWDIGPCAVCGDEEKIQCACDFLICGALSNGRTFRCDCGKVAFGSAPPVDKVCATEGN